MNPVERAGPVMGSLLRNNSTTEAAKRPFGHACEVERFSSRSTAAWSVPHMIPVKRDPAVAETKISVDRAGPVLI